MAEQGGAGSTLGPLEAEVMAVLWRANRPLPVRDVAAELNAGRDTPLAYTTVMTVMSRLAGKGILARFVERAELDPGLRERLRRLMEQQ